MKKLILLLLFIPCIAQSITSKQAQDYYNEFKKVGIYNPAHPDNYNEERAQFILRALSEGFCGMARELELLQTNARFQAEYAEERKITQQLRRGERQLRTQNEELVQNIIQRDAQARRIQQALTRQQQETEAIQRQLDEERVTSQTAIAQMVSAREKQDADIEDLQRQLTELPAQHREQLDELRAQHQRQQEIDQTSLRELNDAFNGQRTEIERLQEELTQQQRTTRETLQQQQQEFEAALAQTKQTHEADIEARQQLADNIIARIRNQYDQRESNLQDQLQQQATAHDQALAQLRQQLTEQQAQSQATLVQQRERMEAADAQSQQEIAAIRQQLEEQIAQTRAQEQQACSTQLQEQKTSLEETISEMQRQTKAAQTAQQQQITELERQRESAVDIFLENEKTISELNALVEELQKRPQLPTLPPAPTQDDATKRILEQRAVELERQNAHLQTQLTQAQTQLEESSYARHGQKELIDRLREQISQQTPVPTDPGKGKGKERSVDSSTYGSHIAGATSTAARALAKQTAHPRRDTSPDAWKNVEIYLFNNTGEALKIQTVNSATSKTIDYQIAPVDKANLATKEPYSVGTITNIVYTSPTRTETISRADIEAAAKKATSKGTDSILITINKEKGLMRGYLTADSYSHTIDPYQPQTSSSSSAQHIGLSIDPATVFRFGSTSYSFADPNTPTLPITKDESTAKDPHEEKVLEESLTQADEAKVRGMIENESKRILQSGVYSIEEMKAKEQAAKNGIVDEGWCGEKLQHNGTILLYSIHGTWSDKEAFGGNIYSLTTYNTFKFACQLAQQEQKRVKIVSVTWSGALSPDDRATWADVLAKECHRLYINKKNNIKKIWMIAHSHGCNVAALTANYLIKTPEKILPDVGVFMSSPALQEPENGLNFKTIYAFYSQGDFTQMLGSLAVGMLERSLQWKNLWQSLKSKINTDRKMPPPNAHGRKVYNIRTMLNGLDRDHINIKWTVMPFLAQIINDIHTYYPRYYNLELNVEEKIKGGGQAPYVMLAIRKKPSGGTIKDDPMTRSIMDIQSLTHDAKMRKKFQKAHDRDISSMGQTYIQGLTWLYNFIREGKTAYYINEPQIPESLLSAIETHDSPGIASSSSASSSQASSSSAASSSGNSS